MNKNIIIGALAAVVIIGGGYLLVKNSQNTSNNTTETTPSSNNTVTNTKSTPPLTLGAPTVETSPNFTASTSTSSVTGRVTPNGVQTVYWFEYNDESGVIKKTTQQSIGSGFYPISSPAHITGLRADTSYSYKLVAKNNFGTVHGSTYSFKTNSEPAPRAAKPTASTRSATDIERTSATLNGRVSPNGWDTNYWFEYGKDTTFGKVTSITAIDQDLNSASIITESVDDLEPATKYYFRLNAQNQFGTVNGGTLSFTTAGPLNPRAPTVSTHSAFNITNNSARITGQINPNGADTTYWFEYSEDSLLGSIIGNGTPIQSLDAGTSPVNVDANISGLKKDTKYYYRLVGRNRYGTVNGDITSFTTTKS